MHLVLYDGDCGLCNRLNRFILTRDPDGAFRFASLQGRPGAERLDRHGRRAGQPDTVYVLADADTPAERLLDRGRAVVFVLATLRGTAPLAWCARRLPATLLDALYDFVAAHRHRWFGHADRCPALPPAHRARFLDEPRLLRTDSNS